VFLRPPRPALFADAFPQELLTRYKDQPPGQPPGPPAQLALATRRQASTQVAEDAVIAATPMERRWPLGLDGLDPETPWSTGTRGALRQRLSAQPLDRRWLARTVALAAPSGALGARPVRAALASSPWWGAGRVAAPYHLWGHALRKALRVLARQQGRGLRAGANAVDLSSLF